MADLTKQVGGRIKQIRKATKFTQKSLAEKTGLSVEFISRLERGVAQPSLKTLSTIARVFKLQVQDLFDYAGPVLFKDKKQEAKQRKHYLDQITSKVREMDMRGVATIHAIIKVLAGK